MLQCGKTNNHSSGLQHCIYWLNKQRVCCGSVTWVVQASTRFGGNMFLKRQHKGVKKFFTSGTDSSQCHCGFCFCSFYLSSSFIWAQKNGILTPIYLFWLPDKVQEGIGSADLLYLLLPGELLFWPFPGVNDKHHDDADDDSENGGGGVVDHCPHPHFTRGSAVQGCHTCLRG